MHVQPEDHLRVLGALKGVHLPLAAGGEDGPLATLRQVVQADGFSCREEVKKILELKNPESNRKKGALTGVLQVQRTALVGPRGKVVLAALPVGGPFREVELGADGAHWQRGDPNQMAAFVEKQIWMGVSADDVFRLNWIEEDNVRSEDLAGGDANVDDAAEFVRAPAKLLIDPPQAEPALGG